ncbi:Wzz/FepE/Etk N-terminal domain-containing protein [Nocardia stercoris]|uniref:Protein tyrosine kinase n=1 Tax=Nocardia stercoris TaxID=2483361 RepID=A0A3M2L3G6_9NOCA|nr:Wzz/FepE/Etk N-terminal domain-containing protein [Nocardia stercoris]RMI32187.1 protein tyrosine kinase [Nocardia stercoris]
MSLSDIVRLIRRRWPIVAVALVLCVVASYGYLKTLPKTYTATSTCYVKMATGTSVNDSYQGGMAAQQRVRSYLDIAQSETVAQRVKDQLGLHDSVDGVRGRISAASPPASMLISISAKDSTASGARTLADEAVSQFRALVAQLEYIQVDAAPAARVDVIDQAALPAAPSSPAPKRILMLGILAGLFFGMTGALAVDRLDRRLRTAEEVAKLVPAPILGVVDEGRPGAEGELRRLRSRIDDRPDTDVVLLTSLSPRTQPEVAIGLARAYADTGAHTLLIDADTTGGGPTPLVPVRARAGLSELLRESAPLSDAVVSWGEAGVWLLGLGTADRRTPDLLASQRFADLMKKLRGDFDHIVIAAAPVTVAADAIALAGRADATLGLVELEVATGPQISGAVATFGADDPRLTGAVVFSRPASGSRNPLQRLWKRG